MMRNDVILDVVMIQKIQIITFKKVMICFCFNFDFLKDAHFKLAFFLNLINHF